jgi:hypothetical protein
MKMTRFCTSTNYRTYQDEINWTIQNKKEQIDIMFLSLNNQIAQLAGNQHQITFYNPIVVTITK